MSLHHDVIKLHGRLYPQTNGLPAGIWQHGIDFDAEVAGTSTAAAVWATTLPDGARTALSSRLNRIVGPTVQFTQRAAPGMSGDEVRDAARELALQGLADALILLLGGTNQPPVVLSGTFGVSNGSEAVTTTQSQVGTIAVGNSLWFGGAPTPYAVTYVGASSLVLATPFAGTTTSAVTAIDIGKVSASTWPASFGPTPIP